MAIRYVTALAVAGLEPAQVAVIDSRAGMVLAPGTDNRFASALTEASEREAKLKAEIEELLAARVGRDRARVSVSVETHREAETVTERVIQPDTRVTIHSETAEISDTSSGADGSVTVASNLPTGDAAAGNTRESARTETRERVNYDYSEVRRETVRQAGAIRRISVAVLVDGIVAEDANGDPVWRERPPEELQALRELVIAAIGFDETRGDIVTVDSMAFQPDATPGALVESGPVRRFVERNAMTLIQLGFLAVVAIVLAMTVIRPLLRAGREGAASSGGLAEVTAEDRTDGPRMLDPATDGTAAAPAGLPDPVAIDEPDLPPQEALRNAVSDRPDDAVAMLKEWLDTNEADQEVAA
jgi:flagellar M-ring protein FliF